MKNTMNLTQIIIYLVLGFFMFVCPAAAENSTNDSVNQKAVEKDEGAGHSDGGSFYLGFRWFDADNLGRSAQYEPADEFSPVLGFEFDNYPLPNRYSLLGEYRGSKDFYGDISYAYSDIFKNNTIRNEELM